MKQLTIFTVITVVIVQAVSQTIYVDYDTGKILKIEEEKVAPQNPHWRHRHHQQIPSMMNNYPQRNDNQNNRNTQWVCVNSVTRQSIMIDTAGNPGLQNSVFQNQFYNNNNMNNNQGPSPNPGPQIMVSDNRNAQQETRSPPPLVTSSSPPASQTSAPVSNIDWTQYLGTTTTTTTKKPATNLNTAIDGEGILQPRIFE